MTPPDLRGGVYDGHGRPLVPDALPWEGPGNVHELRRAARVLTLHASVEAAPWPALIVALPLADTPTELPDRLLADALAIIQGGGSVALRAATVGELEAPIAQLRAGVSGAEAYALDPSEVIPAQFDPAVRSPAGAPTEAVPLTMQQLAVLAEWHQHEALTASVPDDVAHHQREALRLVDAAIRLTMGTAPPPPPPAPALAPSVTFTTGEMVFLADEHSRLGRVELEDGRLETFGMHATRALHLRTTAHAAEPGLSLEYGDPRFPGMSGMA